MQSSFVKHERYRYLKVALVLLTIICAVYIGHDPKQPANGGTWYGYTLGTIGAVLILWLLYLGRRKRNFAGGWGTVRGWVSAHIYLGASLLIIATLHTGFQLGLNIHTLAYVLMCLVIFSGFFGVWAYRIYPPDRNLLKNSQSLDDIFIQLEELNNQLKKVVSGMAGDIRDVVTSSIDRTEIGGGFLDQLSSKDKSKFVVNGVVMANEQQVPTVDWLVRRRSNARGSEVQGLDDVIGEISARQRLLKMLNEDIRMLFIQDVWLFFHIPMSFGLLAALAAHIVSVFIYW